MKILFLFLMPLITPLWVYGASHDVHPSPPSRSELPGSGSANSELGPSDLERPPLLLIVGEQRLLTFRGLTRYSAGGNAIHVTGAPDAHDALMIKGIAPGYTDFWVWKADGKSEHRAIEVQKFASDPIPPALERALGRLTETEVYYSPEGLVLRGKIRSFEEAARLRAVLGQTQNISSDPKASPLKTLFPIENETEIAPELLNEAKNKMEAWLDSTPLGSRFRAETQDGALLVFLANGSVEGPTERKRIEQKIRSIFPLTEIRIDSLADSNPTVHFKVYLLELKKTHLRSLGLGWPGSQEGAFRVSPAAINSNVGLDLTLNALENDGSAKILSNPELVVRAPGEAELFSGGELPIREQSAYFANITWKTFGLTLKLNVTQSAGDRVRLDITTEVSRLDATLSDDKIPGLQANRMKTQVDAHFGKPLLLSGLLQQELHKQVKGLPFLKDIPVLGALFGSEDYLTDRSELVAILLPSAEVPVAPMEKVARIFPTGPLPPRQHFPDPKIERAAKESADYPWNVLE